MADLMAPSLPAAVDPGNTEPANARTTSPKAVDNDKVAATFRSRIEAAKRNRRQRHAEMKRNVELRQGRTGGTYLAEAAVGVVVEDELKSEINPDWSLTKVKTANLYSQVPEVQITHENTQYAQAIPAFRKALNYELGEKRAKVAVCMEEVLNDVVNAAGFGAVVVGYEARFRDKQVPADDSLMAQFKQMLGMAPAPPTTVPELVSDRFFARRISPGDAIWPAEFVGSDFDDADFVGYSGRASWPDAKNEWKLPDSVKDDVISDGQIRPEDDLRSDPEKGMKQSLQKVKYDEIYYWRHKVDPEEKNFKAIWKMVFVEGMDGDKPVIHEPWKGQTLTPDGLRYVGACKFPVRFLTLTYITDNPIPPSDTAAGRPQVMDLRRSRQQMFENRDRSRPIRGFDVNRVDDPIIVEQLMKGTYQGIIPFNGNAQNSIWEVARASYPSEDFAFDQATKQDLYDSWMIGPNQLGNIPSGEKATKAEVDTTQGNFNTRIAQERSRVGTFFLSIAEVMAGLMALYSTFPNLTDQERQQMQQVWDNKNILHDLVFKIRPDSTVMLEAGERINRLMQWINMTAKSGYTNVKPAIVEMTELTGLDPTTSVIDPQPAPPEQPKISFAFSSKDDIVNPVVFAILEKAGLAPSKEDIQKAEEALSAMGVRATPPNPAAALQGEQAPAQNGPPANPEPPSPGANQGWEMASKVADRSRDMGGQ